MAIEIVDFPIKNGDFPWQNVSSPEGIHPDPRWSKWSIRLMLRFGTGWRRDMFVFKLWKSSWRPQEPLIARTYVDTPKHTQKGPIWLESIGSLNVGTLSSFWVHTCRCQVAIIEGQSAENGLHHLLHGWRQLAERRQDVRVLLHDVEDCLPKICSEVHFLEEWRRSSSNPLHVYHVLQDGLWYIPYIYIYISIQI